MRYEVCVLAGEYRALKARRDARERHPLLNALRVAPLVSRLFQTRLYHARRLGVLRLQLRDARERRHLVQDEEREEREHRDKACLNDFPHARDKLFAKSYKLQVQSSKT